MQDEYNEEYVRVCAERDIGPFDRFARTNKDKADKVYVVRATINGELYDNGNGKTTWTGTSLKKAKGNCRSSIAQWFSYECRRSEFAELAKKYVIGNVATSTKMAHLLERCGIVKIEEIGSRD